MISSHATTELVFLIILRLLGSSTALADDWLYYTNISSSGLGLTCAGTLAVALLRVLRGYYLVIITVSTECSGLLVRVFHVACSLGWRFLGLGALGCSGRGWLTLALGAVTSLALASGSAALAPGCQLLVSGGPGPPGLRGVLGVVQ